ncbi:MULTISPECIES: type II toxin-antitoxin system PemK/MazF family toxin [unclassified Thermococcus]|uniref:type II toxin-antitoxin system PemK/MazF family toxin n=1 Tax=unclassified Thermococcus TaxID=2627626 RepID=UPI0014321854|nr:MULTISPECIES: type II toxin-antitoxin system PemK/MazF family toxin [unclassified Thermococcus]NJE46950.1 type II toxin-antitoxin system PemK/MazF family toxin [Thermococcus sp. GR7]NJE79568.1 type II toxin-antitoxin system PemK/MazF family toxin [Thermococcus sp. GR4]NJF22658.1 type II toxin-antitoxin system PemK/MazF family toxin [Thermococcus sp. GR5]NJF26173.1 type II toxin-antitoxin system PemK/MazF family toxin [Thermococcus sp. Bubb.Bath]
MSLKGKIVLVHFPFTDLRATKLRPALVLYEGKDDVVVAFISSRLEKFEPKTDVLVERSHLEFKVTGLKVSSIIKLNKIATVHKGLLAGILGEVGDLLKEEINVKLCNTLRL